jgi:hypothetical protein
LLLTAVRLNHAVAAQLNLHCVPENNEIPCIIFVFSAIVQLFSNCSFFCGKKKRASKKRGSSGILFKNQTTLHDNSINMVLATKHTGKAVQREFSCAEKSSWLARWAPTAAKAAPQVNCIPPDQYILPSSDIMLTFAQKKRIMKLQENIFLEVDVQHCYTSSLTV